MTPFLVRRTVTVALVSIGLPAYGLVAQGACEAPSYREFDFWIGDWDIANLRLREDGTWADSGSAMNRVFPVAAGCGIVELWDGYVGDNHIRGFSVRAFSNVTDKWRLVLYWPQANRGGFGMLTGEFRLGRGDFFSEFTSPDGTPGLTRYSFADIGTDSFRWNDGTSMDGGQTWRTSWIMEFRRRNKLATPLINTAPYGTKEAPLCSMDEYRASDFLIGTWESTGPEGSRFRVEGTPINDGCAVMEFITGDNGTNAFTVVAYETRGSGTGGRWTMYHLDGGAGFDVYHGQATNGAIRLLDGEGEERVRLVPGDSDTLTRVVGGREIQFVRR